MSEPTLTLAAVGTAADALEKASGAIGTGVADIGAIPGELHVLPFFQHLSEVMPAADLFVGGGILIIVMLIHATGVRAVTNYVSRRTRQILEKPTNWRADLLMSGTVFLLLSLHLIAIFVWASALIYAGLVSDWHSAGFFAGNTYTTVGYGAFILPPGWRMLAPLIAISGLFTFGWSGSVLVDLVGRCQKIKDQVNAARASSASGG